MIVMTIKEMCSAAPDRAAVRPVLSVMPSKATAAPSNAARQKEAMATRVAMLERFLERAGL